MEDRISGLPAKQATKGIHIDKEGLIIDLN